jgi:hypothetical protein
MSSLSLTSSIRSFTVPTGVAPQLISDRFLNSDNTVCIPWNGQNNKGQFVHHDSVYTKTAGCNKSNERVDVENELRPSYSAFINLNTDAIKYGGNNTRYPHHEGGFNLGNQEGGSYGHQLTSSTRDHSSLFPYEMAMSQDQEMKKVNSFRNVAHQKDMESYKHMMHEKDMESYKHMMHEKDMESYKHMMHEKDMESYKHMMHDNNMSKQSEMKRNESYRNHSNMQRGYDYRSGNY